jgi:hypothetical protein
LTPELPVMAHVWHFRVGDIHSNGIQVLLELLVCWESSEVCCPACDT